MPDPDERATSELPVETLHFVFVGPPGPECGRFIECETPDGRSVNAGTWHEREDGHWELRVTLPSAVADEREAAWRDGFDCCRQCVRDNEAGILTDDVEQDCWQDSATRARQPTLPSAVAAEREALEIAREAHAQRAEQDDAHHTAAGFRAGDYDEGGTMPVAIIAAQIAIRSRQPTPIPESDEIERLREALRATENSLSVLHQYRCLLVSALGNDRDAVRGAELAFDKAFNAMHSARTALRTERKAPADIGGLVERLRDAAKDRARMEHETPGAYARPPRQLIEWKAADLITSQATALAERDAEIAALKREMGGLKLQLETAQGSRVLTRHDRSTINYL